MCKQLLLLCLLLSATFGFSQPPVWKLAVDKDDIKIYTRPIVNSSVKAVKVECNLPVHPSALVAAIMDIDNSSQWVYHTKVNRVLKKVSASELYYYSEVVIPFPFENRDYITHIIVTQNPATKVITVDAPGAPTMLPEKKGLVRVTHSIGKWIIQPYENGATKLSFELEVEPGGAVPAWLVNLFATQGPMETFKKLKLQVLKPEYKNVKLGYLVD